MRLILVAAVVVGCALALPSDWKEKLEGKLKDKLEKVKGHLSEKNRDKMEKAMKGLDIEKRRERLQKMSEKFSARKTMTEEQKREIGERLKSIRKVKIDHIPNENATDLFEVNVKEGVDEYMFQGDIHLTESQMDTIEEEISDPVVPSLDSQFRSKRQATTQYPKWTSNNVYYFFDSSINARKKASVAAALAYLQSRTCLNFSQSSTAANRIRVFNGAGCYSSIGMIGGQQDLSLGDGCEVIGTAAHEFTHALGVWHTQMRADRDTYVTIDLSTVDASKQNNFAKLQANQMTAFTPYEYGSFMHYGANSFVNSAGQISIVPKDTNYVYTMGNRQISFYDIKMINDFYGCSSKCPAATSAQCQNGGVPNPRNCAICNCPLGYAGNLCDQRPTGCGSTIAATASWQNLQFSFGDTVDKQNVRDDFTLCNHWITAPAGMKVQTKITSMFNPQCQFGCPFNGIEIKTNSEKQKTNPRYCCPEFNNIELTSELNPTPIISFNRYYYTTFNVQYRYVSASGGNMAPPTTPPPALNPACVNTMSEANCVGNKNAGFCTSTSYSFQTIKYNCARTCELCGKAAPNCVDTHAQCVEIKAQGMCTSLPPLEAEYHCARTCGFCTNPL